MVKWSQMPEVQAPKAPSRWPMVVVPALVAVVFTLSGLKVVALVLLGLATVIGLASAISPAVEQRIHRLAAWLSTSAGVLLGWLLLMPFYMLLMVPMAALSRLQGSDRLQLKIDPKAKSYWNDHGPMSGRYERPF